MEQYQKLKRKEGDVKREEGLSLQTHFIEEEINQNRDWVIILAKIIRKKEKIFKLLQCNLIKIIYLQWMKNLKRRQKLIEIHKEK